MIKNDSFGQNADLSAGRAQKALHHRMFSVFTDNKSQLILSLVFTFVWGILAHGYAFMHNYFSHDSLHEFNADVWGNTWKIQLGRFLVPI